MARGVKRRITVLLSITVGISLFIYILNDIGVEKIVGAIGQLGVLGTLVSFLNVCIMVFGWIWSWKILLNAYGLQPSWGLVTRAVLGGYALSYLTPSMYFGGEPLRVYMMSKELGVSSSKVTATVVIWKILEGGTLFSLVVFGSFNVVFSGALNVSEEISLAAGNLLVMGAWGLMAWSFITKKHWISRFCGFLQKKLPFGKDRLTKTRSWLIEAETSVHFAFSNHTKAVLIVLVLSLIINLTVFVRPWLFFSFASGGDIMFGFRNLAFIFALFFFLSTFLWLTPGGIGTSEFGLIGIFQLVNNTIPGRDVVAYSLTIKGMELFFIIIGLFILLHMGALKFPKFRKEDDPPPADSS